MHESKMPGTRYTQQDTRWGSHEKPHRYTHARYTYDIINSVVCFGVVYIPLSGWGNVRAWELSPTPTLIKLFFVCVLLLLCTWYRNANTMVYIYLRTDWSIWCIHNYQIDTNNVSVYCCTATAVLPCQLHYVAQYRTRKVGWRYRVQRVTSCRRNIGRKIPEAGKQMENSHIGCRFNDNRCNGEQHHYHHH